MFWFRHHVFSFVRHTSAIEISNNLNSLEINNQENQVPFISIIIPTFNSSKTIRLTLDSIWNQTFSDYEILLIDNESVDQTLEIVKSYAAKNLDISIMSCKDKGVYDAMNKGIDLAKGKWLYFLGSDDYLHDNLVLEEVVNYLREEVTDIVYGDAIMLGNKQRHGGKFDTLRIHTQVNLCHQTIFYKRSIFDKIGKYNLLYPVVADWDMNIRCFRHPDIRTLYINRTIVFYNDMGGISSVPHYDPFYDELPIHYINQMINSRTYKLGVILYNILSKVGLIKPTKKLFK